MARELPFLHRRMAEESVRRGMAAAVVMEAAAREWTTAEGDEPFPAWLVRREVLRPEQVAALEEVVREEGEPDAPAPGAPAAPGDAAPPRAPHPSEVVKGYRILERLGRGGMGSVYRAEQAGMNRVVALKILRRPLGESPEQVERLKREARLVGSLDHPNIVRGLDVGQHGPYHYFAMEFVEGETLRDVLKRRGVLPEAEALRILEQVTLALDHAHSRAVIHRDVKPGNIILTTDGTPKLTDYGLAKGPSDFSLTQSGVTIGTPQYLSPEQAREPARVDIRTDLYSLGATAYHMLAGIPPHTSETLAGLLTKVLYEKPRTVRQVNPRVSAGASFLVEKLMAKQKRHRYQTPREVLRDLRALAAGKSIVPRDWAGDFDVQEARRKLRMVVAGSVAALFLLLVAVAFLQHKVAVEEQRGREDRAAIRLEEILPKEIGRQPRDHAGWFDRLRELRGFIAHPEHGRTPSRAVAEAELGGVEKHIEQWEAEVGVLRRAQALADERGDYRGACAEIDRAFPDFQAARGFGRDPLRALLDAREAFAQKGLRIAEREAAAALEQAEKVAAVPGAAAQVEKVLQAARDRIEALLVLSDTQPPVQKLDGVLGALRSARAVLEDSILPRGARDEVDRALREGRFAAAYDLLERARQRMEEEPSLLLALQAIPRPAAEDLRGDVLRRIAAARERNGAWLRDAFAAAEAHAVRGEYDAALSLLESAEARSLPDPEFAAAVGERRQSVADRRDRADEESRTAVAALLDRFLEALTRRDYEAAGRHLREAEAAPGPAAPDRRLTLAATAARELLHRIERIAFDPLREKIRQGKDFKTGLRFQGRRPRDLQVSNVTLRDTPTGEVVVYDAPNERGLQFALHGLTLDVIFFNVPLPAEGLTVEQALVRGAMVLVDADPREVTDLSLREVEAARTHVLRAKDSLPGLGPVADALVARADAIRERILGRLKNLEKEAEETWASVEQALQNQQPLPAKRGIELLLGALKGTEFVKSRLPLVLEKQREADRMALSLRVRALFPRAEVSEAAPAAAGRGSLTRVLWTFAGDGAVQDFVPPEDGGAPLYAWVPEEGGRLAFRGPEPGGAPDAPRRWTSDSPVVIECPFKPSKTIAVSFTYRSEAPLALQVSILTCHVVVLTDDGTKESGRGIYAWQSPDWRDADGQVRPEYRHDVVARTDLSRVRDTKGEKYFQFEPGRAYAVRVLWENGHLRLFVDGQEKWNAPFLDKFPNVKVPRIRLLTWVPGWIDDLALEGEIDPKVLDGLLRGR